MFKIVIAGGRNFINYALLKQSCDEILSNITDTIIVISGKANGADTLGEDYANERGYKIQDAPAKWNDLTAVPCKIKYNKFGKPYNSLAGFNRNKEMVDDANLVIVFWDGKSSGTKDTIDYAKRKNIEVKIIYY